MAKLIFNAADVKRVVEHSLAAPEQREVMDGFDDATGKIIYKPATAPSVILVHDHGIYLMSNGSPGDPRDPNVAGRKNLYAAYAKGCDPAKDAEWYDTAHDLVGGDDFAETLPWASEIATAIKSARITQVIVRMSSRQMSLSFK